MTAAVGPAGATPGFPQAPAVLLAVCLLLFCLAYVRGHSVRLVTATAVTLGTRLLMVGLSNGHTPRDAATYFHTAGALVAAGRDPLTQQPRFQWNFLPLMPYVFAVEQHLVRFSVRRNLLDLVAFGQLHLHPRPRRPEIPLDVVEFDSIFMLKHSTHPHRRRLLKLAQADALAHQIFRLADAAFSIDKDIRMAKGPRRKHGNRG